MENNKKVYKSGNFEIKNKELPDEWKAYQEDEWSIVIENSNFKDIIVFFAGRNHTYNYIIEVYNSSTDIEPKTFSDETPTKEDVVNYIKKVENIS